MKIETLFEDCELSISLLKEYELSDNDSFVRIQWLTCLTILRAIGHVHERICSENNKLKEINRKLFNEKKNDLIFSKFIKEERDCLLKEYEYSVDYSDVIKYEPIFLTTKCGDKLTTSEGELLFYNKKNKISNYKKVKGYKSGEVPSLLIIESLDWWRGYIFEFNERSIL